MIIKEFKPISEVSRIILGFPGVGMVGSIATEFMIHKLGFTEMGHIRSEKLPSIAIIRKSRPEAPIRIYQKDENVILVSDVMIPDELSYEFSKDIANWVKSKKPKEVVIIGGSEKKEDGKVFVVSWKDEYLNKIGPGLEQMKLGFVVGVFGPLMMEFMEKGIRGYMIMAEAERRPDPLAAAKIIRHLSARMKIKIDPSPLEKVPAESSKEKEKAKGGTWDPYPSIYG